MAQAISAEMGAPIALARAAQVGAGLGHLKNTIRAAKTFAFKHPLGDHYCDLCDDLRHQYDFVQYSLKSRINMIVILNLFLY